jgi:hypothetical protein
VKIARRIAMLCRQPHRTITVGADFLAEFPRLAEKTVFVSDGTMDVTGPSSCTQSNCATDRCGSPDRQLRL